MKEVRRSSKFEVVLQCSAVPYCATLFGKLFSLCFNSGPWRSGQKHTSATCSMEQATSKGPTMTCLMSRIRKQNASASPVFADAQEMMTQLIILAKVMIMKWNQILSDSTKAGSTLYPQAAAHPYSRPWCKSPLARCRSRTTPRPLQSFAELQSFPILRP